MEKLFLLDAYALIYRAYYALIRAPRINSKGMNTSAIFGFVNTLEELYNKENPTHIGIAFDPSGPTFRHEAFPAYKAQRESTPEDIRRSVPIIKDIIRAYRIPILEVAGYEADDVVGTLAAKASQQGFQTFMMTPDKDYGQLVTDESVIYKPGHGSTGFEILGVSQICEKYGIDRPSQVIDILGLMGDAVDNVPGCPGVGEKTAKDLVQRFGTIEGIYEHIDEVKGKLREKIETNREQVLFSKYLVTIKTDVPIDFEPEKLKCEEPDKAELKKIFEELEFRSFIKKMEATTPPPASQQVIQGDLFSQIPDEEPEKILEPILTGQTLDEFKVEVADSEEKRKEICDKIFTTKVLGLELTTTTLSAIDAKITGFAVGVNNGKAYYIPFNEDEKEMQQFPKALKEILEDEKIEKIGHDLKFALFVFSNYGIHVRGKLFDTMLAHYVIQPEIKHELDYLSEIYLGHHCMTLEGTFGAKWREERDMSRLSVDDAAHFAGERAATLLPLCERLKTEMQEGGETALFRDIEMPLTSVLAGMEHIGVLIDEASLRETSRLFTARMNDYEQQVYQISGQQFNLSSPKQVGEVLFDVLHLDDKAKKTKSGQYVTSEAVLEALKPKSEAVGYLLKYRGMKKLLSTYVDALPSLVNPRTGHIHTSFNQAVTATGRLSSSNPNLQNIPVRGDDGKEIRKAFIPEPGQQFFSADYSQIELRIMAHLSQDRHMIEAFLEGDDIHTATAAKIYQKSLSEVTPTERRKAKTANFGIIYGISAFGLAQRIDIPRSEAKELIESYFRTYPDIKRYMEQSIEEARSKKYIETLFHRRRYLPDITSANAVVRGYAERNAINAPIQGSAADIIKVAMIRIARRFEEEHIQSKMILQVHDELNFSVLPEEHDQVEHIVKYEMEHACSMSVPLLADCGWGNNWLEAH